MPQRPDSRDEALRTVLETHLDEAFRMATMILGDRTAAEDAVAEAVVRAWSARRRLRDPEVGDRWFRRIVVNVCRTELRRRGRRPTLTLDQTVVPLVPDVALRSDDRDEIGRAPASSPMNG
jgi:DNA-directed RNA polymerase specialized sigma24 family protein